jgi:3,4-dihydroxy 2-butanone 4-phosphate synthase/GTP cyclohydrolase II
MIFGSSRKVTPNDQLHGNSRTLICAPLTESRCKEWDYTSWSVIILIPWKLPVSTGISAADRAKTILSLANADTKPHDLADLDISSP